MDKNCLISLKSLTNCLQSVNILLNLVCYTIYIKQSQQKKIGAKMYKVSKENAEAARRVIEDYKAHPWKYPEEQEQETPSERQEREKWEKVDREWDRRFD